MNCKVVCTMATNAAATCPHGRLNRPCMAQRLSQLWVSDFTYVSTGQDFVYVAFAIDDFTRRIVGSRVSIAKRRAAID